MVWKSDSVMPDLIRHPEHIEIAGPRLSPGGRMRHFLRMHQFLYKIHFFIKHHFGRFDQKLFDFDMDK